jgi:hypothetical protein
MLLPHLSHQEIADSFGSRSRLEELPAVGCKKPRSRLEKHPQWAGNCDPQSVGTNSAVGWKLTRSGLEKSHHIDHCFQVFGRSHRFLACFTVFAS